MPQHDGMPAPVTFWFEFASTYSYLSAMRLEDASQKRGIEVIWRPFLLGPIFAKQGWNTSPFNTYPAKGKYMWRDMQRRCDQLGLPLHPSFEEGQIEFPQHSVRAARSAICALQQDWGKAFCRLLFSAQFADGQNIANANVIASCVERAGGDAGSVAAQSQSDGVKRMLRENTETAETLGVFGAPSFVIGKEVFWGDDRLEDALDWALKT